MSIPTREELTPEQAMLWSLRIYSHRIRARKREVSNIALDFAKNIEQGTCITQNTTPPNHPSYYRLEGPEADALKDSAYCPLCYYSRPTERDVKDIHPALMEMINTCPVWENCTLENHACVEFFHYKNLLDLYKTGQVEDYLIINAMWAIFDRILFALEKHWDDITPKEGEE